MKEIFSLRQTDRLVWEKYKLNLDIPSYNQVTFGRKAWTFFGPKTWISLLYHTKSAENLLRHLKQWLSFGTEKAVAVKFVVKSNFFSPIRLAENFCSEIQGYQMTHAFADPEVKLVTRVTTKLLRKSDPITYSNLLNFSFKTVYKIYYTIFSSNSIWFIIKNLLFLGRF